MTKNTDILRRSANFSRCRQYRYALWRQWGDGEDFMLLIGLNPSTADHRQDDPTIRRCMGFARDWGYSGLCVANLFAYCATYPNDLFAAPGQWDRKMTDGCENWLDADLVVAAWGNLGHHMDRAHTVARQLDNLHHHQSFRRSGPPLYLPKHLAPPLGRLSPLTTLSSPSVGAMLAWRSFSSALSPCKHGSYRLCVGGRGGHCAHNLHLGRG